MSRFRLRQIDAARQLRDVAAAWDRLWERCNVSLPTARAELVAEWVEHFAARAALRVLMLEQGGELVAALPLVGRRVHGVLPAGDLTWNDWSPNGELLVDPSADRQAVLDVLVDGLERTGWPLLWFDFVPLEFPQWESLVRTLDAPLLSPMTR